MKKLLMIACFGLILLSGYSQSKKYEELMKKNLMLWDSAKTNNDLLKVANEFEKISVREKKDWLSNYYAGMCYVVIAFDKAGDEIDTWTNKAETFCNKADSLSKNNSEVFVLKSMIASSRIGVNPMARGQKYGALSREYINTAIKLNENNPRAHLQSAQGIYFTPEMFGGGPVKAKPVFEKAIEKFKVFKPVSAIHPRWGKEMATKQLKDVEKELKSNK